MPLAAVELEPSTRYTFFRDEKDAFLEMRLKYDGGASAPAEAVWRGRTIKLPRLSPGAEAVLRLPVETRLFPGSYTEKLSCGGREFPVTWRIGPQPRSDVLPIMLWGFKGDHRELQNLGFNGGIMYRSMRMDNPESFARLENAVCDGFRYYGAVSTSGDKELKKRFPCLRRDGTEVEDSVDASHPAVVRRMLKLCSENVLRSHPAAGGILINSEVRSTCTTPSFVPHQIKAWRKFSGRDVPAEVGDRVAPHFGKLENFPADRVVPDDHPLLEYYRWFWRTGDGWNDLNTRMAGALHKDAAPGFVCFHDPVVRTPPIWSSGGKVDAVNHWTYAYPEPFRITSHIDAMFAMTEDDPGRQVWAMTQIICYRYRLTDRRIVPAVVPEWAKKFPEAEFISIPPDSLREAIWTMISRPVRGILFHGQGSLVPLKIDPRRRKNYYCTNDETRKAMREMLTGVVQPLSPMLKLLGEPPREVAILHSFASSIFAGRGTWGKGGWPDDLSLMMYYAGFNPRVIYEESVLRDGLDGIKILAMPHCDVLPAGVAAKIREFQARGGIVIGDPHLCPAIRPQLTLEEFSRSGWAEAVGKRMLRHAARLRRELRRFLTPASATDNLELLRFERVWKDTSYYFVVNDRRGCGDYVGPWRRVLEKGLPNRGVLTIPGSATAVYELSRGGKVPFVRKNGRIKIRLSFETNDGRIFLPLEHPIDRVELELPPKIVPGEKFRIRGRILDASGKPVPALLPISFTLTDGQGRGLDCGPYRCAEGGVFDYATTCPLNAVGAFHVKLVDRASGLAAEGSVGIGME